MNSPTTQKKSCVSAWDYAILHEAMAARELLTLPKLDREEALMCLNLLRIGRQVLMRLRLRSGLELPQVDLSYPKSASAAALADIEDGESPAGDQVPKSSFGKSGILNGLEKR
jgi:hypothetical protein